MFGVYVNGAIRAAVIGAADPSSRLRQLRRRALRERDAATAAGCLLQLIVEAPPERRVRLLRQYARESGSPTAVYTLARFLPRRAATDAALLRMLRTTTASPDSETEILESIFGPIKTNDVRDLLQRVLRRSDNRFPHPRLTTIALLELVELESIQGNFRLARDLAVQLTRETPAATTFQLLGLATEALRDYDGAIAAYLSGAELAERDGDVARRESLEQKVLALRRKRTGRS